MNEFEKTLSVIAGRGCPPQVPIGRLWSCFIVYWMWFRGYTNQLWITGCFLVPVKCSNMCMVIDKATAESELQTHSLELSCMNVCAWEKTSQVFSDLSFCILNIWKRIWVREADEIFAVCTKCAFQCQVQICDEKEQLLMSHWDYFYFNLATFRTELWHHFPPKPTNDSMTAWPLKGWQVCVRVWQLMLANIKQ